MINFFNKFECCVCKKKFKIKNLTSFKFFTKEKSDDKYEENCLYLCDDCREKIENNFIEELKRQNEYLDHFDGMENKINDN